MILFLIHVLLLLLSSLVLVSTGTCSKTVGSCVFTLITGCIPEQPLPSPSPSPASSPAPSPSVGSITLFIDCIEITSTGYTIYIGYTSTYSYSISIPVGKNNTINPAPNDRGQPTMFHPGTYSGFPFSPFKLEVTSVTRLTWLLQSKTITIDPQSFLSCPSEITLQMIVTTTPSNVNQEQKLQQLESTLSSSTQSSVQVSKVASTDNSEIYTITFTGNASSGALKYCSQMGGNLKNQINGIVSGTVSDTGCPKSAEAITNPDIPSDNNSAGAGFSFLWWYGVIIGAVVLLIGIIVGVIFYVYKNTSEIV